MITCIRACWHVHASTHVSYFSSLRQCGCTQIRSPVAWVGLADFATGMQVSAASNVTVDPGSPIPSSMLPDFCKQHDQGHACAKPAGSPDCIDIISGRLRPLSKQESDRLLLPRHACAAGATTELGSAASPSAAKTYANVAARQVRLARNPYASRATERAHTSVIIPAIVEADLLQDINRP
jgi:hypothetical protein